ncbi:hypothetical protein ACX80L_05330 [Arthrobacter sp. MDT1-48-3]
MTSTEQDVRKKGFWVRALRRTPNWIIFLVIAVLYAVFLLGKDLLTGETVVLADVALAVLSGLALSAVIFWVNRWKSAREKKKPSGSPTQTNVERAMSTRRIPDDASAEQWVPELRKAIRADRVMAWIGPLLFGAFGVMGIYLIIDNPEHPWFWILATIFFFSVGAWYPIWTRRRRKKLLALIAQFPTAGGPADNAR